MNSLLGWVHLSITYTLDVGGGGVAAEFNLPTSDTIPTLLFLTNTREKSHHNTKARHITVQ